MIKETKMYYEVGYRFPYSVKSKALQEWTILSERLRCFEYSIQAYAFQYKEKIEFYELSLKSTKKEDRSYVRKKIKTFKAKLKKLQNENPEYYI